MMDWNMSSLTCDIPELCITCDGAIANTPVENVRCAIICKRCSILRQVCYETLLQEVPSCAKRHAAGVRKVRCVAGGEGITLYVSNYPEGGAVDHKFCFDEDKGSRSQMHARKQVVGLR